MHRCKKKCNNGTAVILLLSILCNEKGSSEAETSRPSETIQLIFFSVFSVCHWISVSSIFSVPVLLFLSALAGNTGQHVLKLVMIVVYHSIEPYRFIVLIPILEACYFPRTDGGLFVLLFFWEGSDILRELLQRGIICFLSCFFFFSCNYFLIQDVNKGWFNSVWTHVFTLECFVVFTPSQIQLPVDMLWLICQPYSFGKQTLWRHEKKKNNIMTTITWIYCPLDW